jgi:two-component system nitrate/nitrite response regulator NarL
VDAIPALKDAAPGTRILMLTVSENEDDLAAALRAGADGYMLKTVESDQLAETIVKVLDGESVISPEMLTKLVSVFRARPAETAPAPLEPASGPSPDLLSPREREILLLIARGDSNKLIARALDIAETTVKIHVQHILRKLGLSSRVQAAVYATSRGLA